MIQYEQSANRTWYDFLGNWDGNNYCHIIKENSVLGYFGGLCGIMFGGSLISVIEFVYFITAKFGFAVPWKRIFRTDTGNHSGTEQHKYHFYPSDFNVMGPTNKIIKEEHIDLHKKYKNASE